MHSPRIYAIHDSAITIEFSQLISEETNSYVVALQEFIARADLPGFVECVPAYSSLTVYFDRSSDIQDLIITIEKKIPTLRDIENSVQTQNKIHTPVIIPVCYDLEFGSDLHIVSAHLGLSIEMIIDLHTKDTYRVYMIGFVPGFPYLGRLTPKLEMPRKKTPMLNVPTGSVAIAGRQTGIYPAEVPGGWHIIGRTPIKLFDKSASPCCLLKAGDTVQFKQISKEEFLNQA